MFRFNTNKLQVPGKLQIGKIIFLLVNFLDRKIPRSLMLSLAFFLFSTGGFLNWFWIVIVSNSPLPRTLLSLLHPLESKLPVSFENFKIKLQILWRFAENYRGLETSSCVSQHSLGNQWTSMGKNWTVPVRCPYMLVQGQLITWNRLQELLE